jgi:hypothetical protein
MKVRTMLAGCGAGILLTSPYSWRQLSPAHDALYHTRLPNDSVIWGVLIDLAVAAILATLLFDYLERNPGGRRNFVWAPIVAAFATSLAVVYPAVPLLSGLAVRRRTAFLVTLAVALFLRWCNGLAYQATARAVTLLLALAGCSIVWLAPELLYQGLRYQPEDWHGYAHVAIRSSHVSDRRIVWLLFDELSYDQTFAHRFPGLAVPVFDQFEHSSVNFEQLQPAGYYTEEVLPSLFSGDTMQRISSDLDGWPSFKVANQPGWHPFHAHSTIFAEAQRDGWSAGIVGWYNPYCRILAGTLDFCYTRIPQGPDGTTSENSALENAIAPIESNLSSIATGSRLLAEQHDEELRAILPQAQALIRDEKIRFVFIHLPVPHPIGIYDRKTGQEGLGGTYIDNLALADRVLRDLMSTLATTASAPKTTIVICSDHSWRVPMWRSQPGWTKEEETASHGQFDPRPVLMIHFPGQSSEVPIAQSFDGIKLHDILVQMLHGDMNSQADLTSWLQDNLPVGLPVESQGGGSARERRMPAR